jgi:hypothetical protein
VREVIEEDAIEIAHRRFLWRGHGFVEADCQHGEGEEEIQKRPDGERAVRSANACHNAIILSRGADAMRGYRGLDCAGWKCEPQIPFGNDKTGGVQGISD